MVSNKDKYNDTINNNSSSSDSNINDDNNHDIDI